MNVGKIDNLIVQDFKDVFSSSDLNTVFKNKYLLLLEGCICAHKVSARSVKAHLYMLVVEKCHFNSLLS